MKKEYIKTGIFALLISIFFFIVFGFLTAVIQNNFFKRMTPVTFLDYLFLILTSLLIGTYIGLSRYNKSKKSHIKCNISAYGGGIGGFLGFGCSLCNQLLLMIFGVAGVMIYVEPYRPLIGSVGVIFMGYSVYMKAKEIRVSSVKSI